MICLVSFGRDLIKRIASTEAIKYATTRSRLSLINLRVDSTPFYG